MYLIPSHGDSLGQDFFFFDFDVVSGMVQGVDCCQLVCPVISCVVGVSFDLCEFPIYVLDGKEFNYCVDE